MACSICAAASVIGIECVNPYAADSLIRVDIDITIALHASMPDEERKRKKKNEFHLPLCPLSAGSLTLQQNFEVRREKLTGDRSS